MDDTGCPHCKTTKYRNPSLKLLVNVCGHALCENCVENLFVRGSGTCPECGVGLRRNNFRLQFFEDAFVEKEVDIRKKILKDFNKKEDDFATLNEYNNYLEEVEHIIFNLVNGFDVEETKKKVEQYKKLHKDLINKNKTKKTKDEEYLEACLEEEKFLNEERTKDSFTSELKDKTAKLQKKEALIEDLMFSDKSATDIVATYQKQAKKQEQLANASAETHKPRQKQPTSHFSTGIKIGQQGIVPLSKLQEHLYGYKEPTMDWCGPSPPGLASILSEGYLDHLRPATKSEIAGGYQAHTACQRALQEAINGLFFTFEVLDVSMASMVAEPEVLARSSSHSSNDPMDAD